MPNFCITVHESVVKNVQTSIELRGYFLGTAVDQPDARNARSRIAFGVYVLSRLLRLTWAHRSIIPVHIGGIRNARSSAGPDRPSAQLNLNQKATYWWREPIDSDELVLKLQRYCD